VDVFTDLSLWESSVNAPMTDDLTSYVETDLVLGDNDFFAGYSVNLAGTGVGGANVNSADNFAFTLGGDLESITFNYDQPQDGVGFTILNSFVSNGLTITINGEAFDVESFIPSPSFEFLGFTDASGISSATFTVTDPGGATEFAAISDVHTSVIPSPASTALLGLGGLIAARRRRA